jgi:HlyD family secretion protein
MRTLLTFLIGLTVVGAAAWCVYSADAIRPAAGAGPIGQAAPVPNIHATGTVEPEDVVEVGAQVLGTVERLGWDPRDEALAPQQRRRIDFSSSVKGPEKDANGNVLQEGTLLAVIDDGIYRARVAQEEANLQRARQEKLQAEARLKLVQQAAEGAKGRAEAELAVAKTAVAVADAAITQSAAALEIARLNLRQTRLTAPIDGVIVDRRVNVGQTVGPVPNAPGLFLIASLKKLYVWASVSETDIVRVHERQKARFTVDAFPQEQFEGEVVQIRFNASATRTGVMYTVVIAVSGAKGKLLPYQTARVELE